MGARQEEIKRKTANYLPDGPDQSIAFGMHAISNSDDDDEMRCAHPTIKMRIRP